MAPLSPGPVERGDLVIGPGTPRVAGFQQAETGILGKGKCSGRGG